MDARRLRRWSQSPRHSRPQQIPVPKGSEEQRQGVHRRCLGLGPPSQLPRLYDLEDGVCDCGWGVGLRVVGVEYVCLYPGWHVCARAGGLHESVVREGVEEGDGEGEVEDGSWRLVRFCVSSFASSGKAFKIEV